mmetsp:Transcript_27045/g.41187  ORF Transcript_27045/g.41187 Transcript_27045/m.41187 type:complete len:226 (-) Transcript_27045:987-1664(-)
MLFADVNELLPEGRCLLVGVVRDEPTELEFQSNNFVTELAVENLVLLFSIGLLEKVLNNGIEDLAVKIIAREQMLGLNEVDPFLVAFCSGLHAREHVFSELKEFLVVIVGGDDVEEESDLLHNVLRTLQLVSNAFGHFLQLLLLLRVLLLPGAFAAAVGLVRAGGTFSEIIVVAASVATLSLFVLVIPVTTLFLFDGLEDFAVQDLGLDQGAKLSRGGILSLAAS